MIDRRRALGLLTGVGLLVLYDPRPVLARVGGRRVTHPDPRPGIGPDAVLPSDRVAPHARELYDRVREIPHVVDGIGCHCGCAELAGMYSLLSCYGESGMAQYCDICSGEGRLAFELHRQGLSLDEIRRAVDRRFG